MRALVILYLLLVTSISGAERAIGTPPTGPAFGRQEPVAGAFEGDDGFVVWTDWRGGAPSVYGSRVNTAGALLDVNGIRINPNDRPATAHGVVSTRTGWVAVWFDRDTLDVVARRVGRDGVPAGEPVALLRAPSQETSIDVAAAGDTIAVAGFWDPLAGTTAVDFAVANQDLTNIRTASSSMSDGVLVSNGVEYVIFGRSRLMPVVHPSRAITISTAGVVGPLAPVSIVGDVEDAFWTGRDFAVRASGVYYRVSRNLDVAGPPITVFTTGVHETITGGSGAAIVIWTDGGTVNAAVLGDLSSDPPVVLGTNEPRSPVRAIPTRFGLVVVTEGLRTTTIPYDLALPFPRPLNGLNEEIRSRAAQWGFAAVRDGSSDLYVFVQSDGDRSRVLIASPRFAPRVVAESVSSQFAPAIASNGTVSLVAWVESDRSAAAPRVIATIVDNEGRSTLWGPIPLGTTPFDAEAVWSGRDTGTSGPAVAWNGSTFFVVWNGMLARFTPAGTVLDSPARSLLPPTFLRREHFAAARLGDGVVVAWTEGNWSRDCIRNCESHVRAVRLTAGGDLNGPVVTLDNAGTGSAVLPDIATTGSTALVVWEENNAIRAATINSSGATSSPALIRSGATRPSVARHGNDFLVAWQSGSTISSATVTSSLTAGFATTIATTSVRTHGPHVWTAPDGKARVAYAKLHASTDWVPQLFEVTPEPAQPRRVRAVRR